MKLVALQRAVARAVMQPLTLSERMQRTAPGGGRMSAYAARYVKPNDRLTSFERLEIYNRQYWFRVLGSMAEDFPGLRAVLGQRRFEDMCRAYLAECPSRSFTLRNLAARLETWLRRNPKWIRGKQTLALDMVRLEWADIEAFDGEAEPALHPEDLNGSSVPCLRLRVQPYVQLVELHYPVDDLALEVREDDNAADFASNALTENRRSMKVRAVAALSQSKSFLLFTGLISPCTSAGSSMKSTRCSRRCAAEKRSSARLNWLFNAVRFPSLIVGDTFDTVFRPGQLWAGSAGQKKYMRGEKAARKE
jgi:hypothetical protein